MIISFINKMTSKIYALQLSFVDRSFVESKKGFVSLFDWMSIHVMNNSWSNEEYIQCIYSIYLVLKTFCLILFMMIILSILISLTIRNHANKQLNYFLGTLGLKTYITMNQSIDHTIRVTHDNPWMIVKRMEHLMG